MHNLIPDLGYRSRQLRKNPGFTSAAMLMLALGIGANTAILSMVGQQRKKYLEGSTSK
jgi:hypothetical protein